MYLIKYNDNSYKKQIKLKNYKDMNGLINIKEIWPELNLCCGEFSSIGRKNIMERDSSVEYIIEDKMLELRGPVGVNIPEVRNPDVTRNKLNTKVPNDYNSNRDWHHNKMSNPQAWYKSTGGQTKNGITIVAGVCEGVSNHNDLSNVLLPNEPATEGAPGTNQSYGGHGRIVAGCIGAKGDNNIGLVGMNWDVKILVNEGGDLSVINNTTTVDNNINAIDSSGNLLSSIELISYYYDLYYYRKLFNDTNGAKGLYIVSINSSWGLLDPTGQGIETCNLYQNGLFNTAYEIMGQEGILNCVATWNQAYDVDSVGDVPSGCNSEYTIAVTATNSNDVRTFSAFGATMVDLAAPGESVPTLSGTSGTGTGSGTSYATPMVTGAVALIYSVLSTTVINKSLQEPGEVALAVKNAILSTVDRGPNGTALDSSIEQTVTKGRLNMYEALVAAEKISFAPPGILQETFSDLPTNIEILSDIKTFTFSISNIGNPGTELYYELSISGFPEGLVTLSSNSGSLYVPDRQGTVPDGPTQQEITMIVDTSAFSTQIFNGVLNINTNAGSEIFNLTVDYSVGGDVNDDGNVNILDILSIINHILGSDLLEFPGRADVNGDGLVNIIDIVNIIYFILNP